MWRQREAGNEQPGQPASVWCQEQREADHERSHLTTPKSENVVKAAGFNPVKNHWADSSSREKETHTNASLFLWLLLLVCFKRTTGTVSQLLASVSSTDRTTNQYSEQKAFHFSWHRNKEGETGHLCAISDCHPSTSELCLLCRSVLRTQSNHGHVNIYRDACIFTKNTRCMQWFLHPLSSNLSERHKKQEEFSLASLPDKVQFTETISAGTGVKKYTTKVYFSLG